MGETYHPKSRAECDSAMNWVSGSMVPPSRSLWLPGYLAR
jgi:hypothetical protein